MPDATKAPKPTKQNLACGDTEKEGKKDLGERLILEFQKTCRIRLIQLAIGLES